MKAKTVYETDDGRVFDSEAAAQQWEQRLEHGKTLSTLYMELFNTKIINLIAPTHDRTSCSDEHLINTYQEECARCVLLQARKEEYWPENLIIKINIENLERKK